MLQIRNELLSTTEDRNRATLAPQPLTVVSAQGLWTALISGRTRIVASHCGDTMCYLEFAPVSGSDWIPLPLVVSETLERLLRGEAQKVIAFDFACSCSTVTTRAQRAFEHIGLSCSPSNVPVLLITLAHSARGDVQPAQVYLGEYPAGSGRLLLTAPRPDAFSLEVLSQAESELVSMMTAAHSRRDMARLRQVSPRTIANQLSQIYKKLGVSSRIPLMIRVAQLAATLPRTGLRYNSYSRWSDAANTATMSFRDCAPRLSLPE